MSQEKNDHSPKDQPAADATKKQPGFVRRVFRYFVGMAILVAIGLFCLPWIASSVISDESAEEWISGQISGDITIGDASIGWQSPIMLNDVTYSNPQGKEVVNVKAVTSNQSLWDFFRKPKRPIELEFEGMKVSLIVPRLMKRETTGESIDLNVVLNEILEYELPHMDRDLTVRLVQSKLELTDPEGNLLTRWSPVSGKFQSIAGSNPEQTLELVAPIVMVSQNSTSESATENTLTIDTKWNGQPPSQNTTPEAFTFNVNCSQQPLTMLTPLLDNYLPELLPLDPLSGEFSGMVERLGQEELLLKFDTQETGHFNETEQPGLQSKLPLKINIAADYSRAEDRIQVETFYAQLDETSLAVEGEVSEVSGKQVVDLKGQFQSPAEGLSKLLPDEIKENIKFKDVQMSEISMKGPLRPDPAKPFDFIFELSTMVSWTEATAYGLQSNNGKVKFVMRGDQLEMTPVSLPINEGQIRKLPTLDLSTKPISVSFEKGLMLDRINLTEQICSDWLRFVSPMLSDATRPSGTFSLIAEAGKFQLGQMDEAKLAGRIHIHRAQVRPGPLTDELLDMVAAIQVLKNRGLNSNDLLFLEMDNQTIEYQVIDGRVYHAGFQFRVGNFVFASNGSVGFDESVDVVITMDFPKELAGRGPILQSLMSQPLEFHVTGTLDKPKIKGEKLKDMGKRIGIEAAEGLLQKILENRQKRGPKKRRKR